MPSALEVTEQLLLSVGITNLGWLFVTMITPPDHEDTLRHFYHTIRPGGWGWQRFANDNYLAQSFTAPLVGMLSGCGFVYATLFGMGQLLYGNLLWAGLCAVAALVCAGFLFRTVAHISLMH